MLPPHLLSSTFSGLTSHRLFNLMTLTSAGYLKLQSLTVQSPRSFDRYTKCTYHLSDFLISTRDDYSLTSSLSPRTVRQLVPAVRAVAEAAIVDPNSAARVRG